MDEQEPLNFFVCEDDSAGRRYLRGPLDTEAQAIEARFAMLRHGQCTERAYVMPERPRD